VQTYERIHSNAKKVLEEAGFKLFSKDIRTILEGTGMAGYDEKTGHIHILKDYTQECIDRAPKKLKVDPGRNSFGLGGRLQLIEEKPAIHEEGYFINQEVRPATYTDLKWAVDYIANNTDVIKFSHTPIGVPNGNLYRMARIMHDNLPNDFLKGISMAEMGDKEVSQFVSPDWVHIFCGVESPLTEIPEKMGGIVRSARLGANLGLSTMPMSGTNAPQTPEGLLTLCHAEVLFMIVVAQTVCPEVTCIHYGFPCPTKNYYMMFGSIQHAMMNAAMAHLNMEVTKLPAMQSAGSTHQPYLNSESLEEGIKCRAFLRHVGFHMMRHAFGTTHNTNFFSFQKLVLDVEAERNKLGKEEGEIVIPEDKQACDVIIRKGSDPNYMEDYHTTQNIMCWDWS